MVISFLLIFLLIQLVVNFFCEALVTLMVNATGGNVATFVLFGNTIAWATVLIEVLSTLIVAIIYGLLVTPKGYRKTFYAQPGFYRSFLSIFITFMVIDFIFLLI